MKNISAFGSSLAFGMLASVALSAGAALPPPGITTVPLATITNDRDQAVSEIELMVNKQDMVRGLFISTRKSALADPAGARGQVIPLAALETPEGAVVGQGQGVKAILLSGTIEPLGGTGTLDIRYLTNGIFGRYADCTIYLRRAGPESWQLINAYEGTPVNHIHVKTWALGISTLDNVCPADNG